MIWIGNQTACWAATPVEPFHYALAQGFDAFEWFPDKKPGAGWDESDLDAGLREQIRGTARDRGMRLSVHARWQVNLLAADSYPLVWKDLELARDLGATLLNVHLFHEQGLTSFVEAILPLIQRTAAAGLQLAIENTPLHSPARFNELFAHLRSLKTVETGHVGMCFDLGHANLCSATLNNYLGFFDQLDSRVPIVHLHLHENWGDTDSHLPLFTGPASRDDSGIRGLLVRLRQRNFSGSIILEQWPNPPSLLAHARGRLLELWNSPGSGLEHPAGSATAVLESPAPPNASTRVIAAELVAGDRRGRSWRAKLDFVRGLLDDSKLESGHLIDIAAYLRFLRGGEIACGEDGAHFRPAHHAAISSKIQERLAQLTTSDNAFIVRKIYPWLPSSAPVFQRPEPLTRIRDIAHRNDIGTDLKREIKTTLQNKLHRCAGPEDLATASALLDRVTAPGSNYSPDFVEQFKIFHAELKEFFNARSLDERLAAMEPAVDPQLARQLELFRCQHVASGLPDKIAAFRTLTSLRQSFLDPARRKSDLPHQEFLLADIALEDFAFVLLSEIINACEGIEAGKAWECRMEVLAIALTNLALSGIDAAEANALESECKAWGKVAPGDGHEQFLRVKATVLRCRRLAEDFCARTVSLFTGRVEALGRALGVADHAIRVFSESEVRAHLIFQISKLATNLLGQIGERLGSTGWDVLVGGRAEGRVKALDSLDQLESGVEGPLLVLLRKAAGDEEIPRNIAGIVLAHELPHLSHLGVRARQAGVVFATCEVVAEFERLQRLEGQLISLVAQPEKVAWEIVAKSGPTAALSHRPAPRIPAVRLLPQSGCIPLDHTEAETGGGKAAGARQLAELSRLDRAQFSVPLTLVVPFGVMEARMEAASAVSAEYGQLVGRLNGLPAGEFAAATRRLRELVQQVSVPDAILADVTRQFGQGSRLVVRSSANCEDAEGMAGAGLYDSVMNVPLIDVASAIRTVWASLWTPRAAASRRQAGISHEQAHMAVVIQELVSPDFSFVLHTVNPINYRPEEVYAEIVVGLGQTLASAATRGNPYRLVCDKCSGVTTMLAFANFSQALQPNRQGGLRGETVDYARVNLSRDPGARQSLGRRLAEIGRFVEEALQRPQDIEGVVVNDRIWLVQARPQPGLPRKR